MATQSPKMEQVQSLLERRSKEELVALVQAMLERAPELGALLAPWSGQAATGAAGTPAFWQEAAAAFHNLSHGWGVEERVAEGLEPLLEKGESHLREGQIAHAVSVFQAISAQVMANFSYFNDESGTLAGVVMRCVEGLGKCLAAMPIDPGLRVKLLLALFDIYHFDVQLGGTGMGDAVPDMMVNYALGSEVELVADWLLAALARTTGTDWSTQYQRQAYNEFLLRLHQHRMDDDAFLRFCRESHRSRDLVDRLLDLHRVDEAHAAAVEAADAELPPLAEAFLAHGYTDVAESFVSRRAEATGDARLMAWLKDHYRNRSNTAEALRWARRLFAQRPTLEQYEEIRGLIAQVGTWTAVRRELLEELQARDNLPLQAEVFLREGDLTSALALLQKMGYADGELVERVALAAETQRPRAALELYAQRAEDIIARRDRTAYGHACENLLKVRRLYGALGEPEGWERYLARIKQEYAQIRALKEEMGRAGL